MMGKSLKSLLTYSISTGFFLLLCYNSCKPLGNTKLNKERQQFNERIKSYKPSIEIPSEYIQPKRLPIEFLYPLMYYRNAKEKTDCLNL